MKLMMKIKKKENISNKRLTIPRTSLSSQKHLLQGVNEKKIRKNSKKTKKGFKGTSISPNLQDSQSEVMLKIFNIENNLYEDTSAILPKRHCQRRKKEKFQRGHDDISCGLQEYFLEDMPNEVLLKILNYLDIKDILSCAQTSKRINTISHDRSLWQKVNLSGKKVPSDILRLVLNKGCKFLNLKKAFVHGSNDYFNLPSNLKSLDLSSCKATVDILEELLLSCHSLTKLSLNGINWKNIHPIIQSGQSLQILNLTGANLNLESIQQITKNCVELNEVNFSGTNLCENSINYLVKNLTSKVVKISLDGIVGDEHVKILVSRCKKLKALVLGYPFLNNIITDDSITSIVEHLKPTLEELDVSFCNISGDKILELRSMPKLRVLNFLYLPENPEDIQMRFHEVKNLKKQLPNIIFNQENVKIAAQFQQYLH